MKNEVLTTDRTKWTVLTPERRKALYGLVAAIGMVGVGWTAENWEQWTGVAQQVLSVVGLIIAVVHTGGAYVAPAYGVTDSDTN